MEPRTEVALLSVDAEQSMSETGQTSGLNHHVDASILLAYAGRLYGHQPAAWLLPVPAVDLDHGEGLSPTTTAFVEAAVAQADEIGRRLKTEWAPSKLKVVRDQSFCRSRYLKANKLPLA